ncbi:predicted protein [Botrytis cinerea T4]|uniref:Uncharacterized protein n=1 Tax=Botryotinia fuckeliana (strain T4) TaxID=999810 RepID=G2Y3W4_BOTF4|nr:predicted protein [Botrytis cinerea T4]
MTEFRIKTHAFDACLSWLEEIKTLEVSLEVARLPSRH